MVLEPLMLVNVLQQWGSGTAALCSPPKAPGPLNAHRKDASKEERRGASRSSASSDHFNQQQRSAGKIRRPEFQTSNPKPDQCMPR